MNTGEPTWLSPDQVQSFNEIIVEQTGEPFLVLDAGLLESAISSPRHMFLYEGTCDRVVLAVKLLERVARDHCFQQGNKRTAFHAAMAFLEINEIDIDLADTEEFADLIKKLVARECDEAALIKSLQEAIVGRSLKALVTHRS